MPDPTSDTMPRILERISASAPSGVWSRADFLDISTPHGVEKALQRLAERGDIRRPHRGLYDRPAISTLTGKMVFPPRSAFIDAIARRDKLRVLVDGMTAANDLGLTTAVPARSTIYADTYARTIEIEANSGDPKATGPVIYTLDFKRIAAKTAFWAGRPAMRVIQTFEWFRGDRDSLDAATDGIITRLRASADRGGTIVDDLQENIHALPAWIYPFIENIIAEFRQSAERKGEASEHEHDNGSGVPEIPLFQP